MNDFVSKINSISKEPYQVVNFKAHDRAGDRIYHTDIVLVVLHRHVVCCLEAIKDPNQRASLEKEMTQGGRKIVDLSYHEMENFCGNMI